MKMLYTKPSAEMIRFENEDVITMSTFTDCKNPSLQASNPDYEAPGGANSNGCKKNMKGNG